MPHVGAIITFQRAEQAERAKRLMVQKVEPKDFKEMLIQGGEPVRVFKVKPLYVKRRNELLWEAAVENDAKPNWTVRTLTDRNGAVIAKQCRKTWCRSKKDSEASKNWYIYTPKQMCVCPRGR